MQTNKNDPIDECFIDPELDDIEPPLSEDIVVNIASHFHSQLPANQLRTARRPENMAPRTFFLERPFFRLPDHLNLPCLESATPSETGRLKLKIANNQNLSLQQYFGKKKFKCIYNRLETCKKDSKSFQGRLKSIDSLVDYNWKSFKELQQQPRQKSQPREDKIDSDFESGNLCRAYLNPDDPTEYYLLIESDLNTYGYNNWFFFRLKNSERGLRRFTIVNMIKKTSFFSQGMMISVFSRQKHKQQNVSWFKGGERISFGTINLTRNHHLSENYHFLSFQYHFQHDNDEVYFALNQPYTYSRLIQLIEDIKQQPKDMYLSPYLRELSVKTVGYSISNNIIPSIKMWKQSTRDKEVILILGRQHPCETVGSFIAEGIARYLTQKNAINSFLFKTFDVVIIPMVNPDGVIHGSSRCNMAGFDLNRQWGEYIIKVIGCLSEELTPETVKVKQFISNLVKTKRIKYMIDLHGHGKKLNSFFFSCKEHEKEDVRLLSMVMKKLQPRFSMCGCTYGITKDKQNTIRSTINNMGIVHSYTLQTSLYGWRDENNDIKHFNEDDYKQIAKSLMQSIFVIEADSKSTMHQLGVTKEGIVSQIQKSIEKSSREEDLKDDDNDILSDSDPEGDKLDVKELLGKCLNKTLKKKIQEEIDLQTKIKGKKSRSFQMDKANSKSSKNVRQSCPSALNVRGKVSASSSIQKNIDLRASSSKKISLSQKWKERRKEIQQKKKKNEVQKGYFDNINQKITYTKLETRPRLKTQSSMLKSNKAHLPYSNFMAKNHLSKTKHLYQKIKNQFRQFQQIIAPSEEEIRQTEIRKSVLESKYKDLKQESLNVLLTDTLSILKIDKLVPHQKHLSPEIRQNKTNISKPKKQRLTTEPTLHESSKGVAGEYGSNDDKDSVRYRKFRQFLSGSPVKKRENESNSVFYYFPVL